MAAGSYILGWNGSDWSKILATSGAIHINDGGNSITVDGTVGISGTVPVSDAGGSLTVDGTVTANLAAGTNNIGDVDVLTVPAPLSTTGGGTETTALRVTIANDSTGVLSVDDNGSTLSVDDGGSSLTIDNSVLTDLSGSIVNVNDVSATKLVTVGGIFGSESRALQMNDDGWLFTESYISNLTSHDGVASLFNWFPIAGYASSSTPTAVSSGDYSRIWTTLNGAVNIADGNGTISIDDGGGSITVDGTFWQATQPVSIAAAVAVTDNSGSLTVDDGGITLSIDDGGGAITVDGTVSITANSSVNLSQVGGNTVVTGGTNGTLAIGGIQAHDAIYSGNNPVVIGGVAASATPTAVAVGDVARLWTTTSGAVHIADGNSTISIDDGAGSITVDGTVGVSGTVTVADGGGSLTVDGTVSITANSSVNLSQVGGTNTVNGGLAGTLAVGGTHAHDAADSGNPLKIGSKAIDHGSNPTAVAAGDRTDLYANRHGVLWTINGHPNTQSAEYITTASQTDDNILPAISSGTKYVITGITVAASAGNTVNPSVRVGFGLTTVPTQAASGADAVTKVILSHPGIAPGSGISKGHAGGIVGIGGDGEELRITCSAPTSGSLVVQVDYYTIES